MASTNSNRQGHNGGRSYSFLNRPVLIDCNFVVTPTNGLGITSLKGSGVQNVFMHTSTTPARGNNNYLNPNPAAGYALIQLQNNYNRYCGGFNGFSTPLSGSDLAINASALTAGVPYVITSVGAGTAGAVTIAPVADVSGSLASKWFRIYDSYGNNYIIWFSVSGVGTAPSGVSGTLVQQSITSGDSAATIGAALVVTLNGLLAAQPGNLSAPSGVNSFSAAGTTTVTVTNTASVPFPGGPVDGTATTGFAFAVTKYKTNAQNWAEVGVPAGVIPAVGVSFIATAVGSSTGGGSTGLVQTALSSGIVAMEVIGNPSLSLSPVPVGGSPNVGGWILVKMIGTSVASVLTMASYTPAGTNDASSPPIFTGTPAVLTGTIANTTSEGATAPATGSLITMSFMVEAGSILISGE